MNENKKTKALVEELENEFPNILIVSITGYTCL